jgi:hypothetical protein
MIPDYWEWTREDASAAPHIKTFFPSQIKSTTKNLLKPAANRCSAALPRPRLPCNGLLVGKATQGVASAGWGGLLDRLLANGLLWFD